MPFRVLAAIASVLFSPAIGPRAGLLQRGFVRAGVLQPRPAGATFLCAGNQTEPTG